MAVSWGPVGDKRHIVVEGEQTSVVLTDFSVSDFSTPTIRSYQAIVPSVNNESDESAVTGPS